MSANHLSYRYRHPSAFSWTSDYSDRVSSPSIEPEAWLLQRSIPSLTPSPPTQPFKASATPPANPPPRRTATPISTQRQTPDLFTALVFNRDRAYRDRSIAIAPSLAELNGPDQRHPFVRHPESPEEFDVKLSTESTVHHHTSVSTIGQHRPASPSYAAEGESRDKNMSPVLRLRPDKGALKVYKRKERPPRKNTAKSKGKVEESRNRKRPAEDEEQERASKVVKIKVKANTKKKVDTGGNSVPAKASIPEIIELSSDSENEEDEATKKAREPHSTMLRSLRSFGQPQTGPSCPIPASVVPDAPVRSVPKAESPDSISDLRPAPTVTLQQTEDVAVELRRVRLELQAANDRARKLQQEMEKKQADAVLEKQKLEIKHQQEVAKLTENLEAERQKSHGLAEQLHKSSVMQEKLETDHRALQARCDQEKRERKQEQMSHADILEDILKPKSEEKDVREQVERLKKDNARLLAEIVTLKAKAASSNDRSDLSPVPSSTSSAAGEDKKEDNVRKMYIKTKRQHDILQAVANDLATCTRSMDLSSFGEFGRYMKKLRGALEIEDGGQIRPVSNVLKADEDEWGSQGSRT